MKYNNKFILEQGLDELLGPGTYKLKVQGPMAGAEANNDPNTGQIRTGRWILQAKRQLSNVSSSAIAVCGLVAHSQPGGDGLSRNENVSALR